MELALAAGLFSRFAFRPHDMVELLEEAAWTMAQRAERLRGVVRVHTATVEEPAIVVLVDELAQLVSYEPDLQLRRRATSALSLLLSQGRGPGFTVMAAMQDPRKDIVTFRDLFPVRLALRMVETDQTDMVLSAGAHATGARPASLFPAACLGSATSFSTANSTPPAYVPSGSATPTSTSSPRHTRRAAGPVVVTVWESSI
jgi:DNA segregation ATPase FtsK/SpoIIIE, S-DNA-T family